AEDGIRDFHVTGVQTCALPISSDGERRVKTGTNSGLAVRHPRYNSPANTTSVSTPAAQRCALLMPEIMPPTCVRRRVHHSCIAKIGRASCRERVERAEVAVATK